MRQAKKIVLKNSFHNTEMEVDAGRFDPEGTWLSIQLSAMSGNLKSQMLEKKIRETLCGNSDCNCGIVRN